MVFPYFGGPGKVNTQVNSVRKLQQFFSMQVEAMLVVLSHTLRMEFTVQLFKRRSMYCVDMFPKTMLHPTPTPPHPPMRTKTWMQCKERYCTPPHPTPTPPCWPRRGCSARNIITPHPSPPHPTPQGSWVSVSPRACVHKWVMCAQVSQVCVCVFQQRLSPQASVWTSESVLCAQLSQNPVCTTESVSCAQVSPLPLVSVTSVGNFYVKYTEMFEC